LKMEPQIIKREVSLAIGLVVLLLGSMSIATGSYPPMVVVESGSMMHDRETGSLGAIDPGDLVLVMDPSRVEIITFAQATELDGDNEGYESHGMPGDVIIFRKNGGTDTPVIHRALFEVVPNTEGGWNVPGTDIVGVESITIELDYPCYHGSTNLRIEEWVPEHGGYITTGDNKWTNGCQYDQISLMDENKNLVNPIKDEWIIGVASMEIPWIGAVKLFTSGTEDQVPGASWSSLALLVATIIAAPVLLEMVNERIKNSIPEEE